MSEIYVSTDKTSDVHGGDGNDTKPERRQRKRQKEDFLDRHKIHTSEIKNGRQYVTIRLKELRSSFPTLKTRVKNTTDSIATSNRPGMLEALEFYLRLFWQVAAIAYYQLSET